MNEPLENLKTVLTGTRPRAPDTITNYLSIFNQFLTFQGDRIPPATLDVHRYFAYRRDHGMSENSLRTHFAVLKKGFEANDWDFPLTERDRPDAPGKTRERSLLKEEIEQLVHNRNLYSKAECFYLSIGTIFAPRRVELARIKRRYIKGNTIYIDTAKKGEKRTHLIPDEIMPYIEAYHPKEHDVSSLSAMIEHIFKKGLGKRMEGYGWHSFRYPLDTLLMSALAKADKDITFVGYFMRWSRREFGQKFAGSRMAGVYSRPELFSSDPFYIDREVFEVHPFLPLWTDTRQS